MKKIEAIIRHFKLEDVKNALTEQGNTGMTISEVRGFGRQKGHTEMYRGTNTKSISFPKSRSRSSSPTPSCNRARHDHALRPAGQVGDGKIFVTDLDETVRIRTGETGEKAV